jgi:N-acetylmuramic acid 6-phosphate etherase
MFYKMVEDSISKAEAFLEIAPQFKLGGLITEASNPATSDLSNLARHDLQKAISVLKDLDSNTLHILADKKKDIFYLKNVIRSTLDAGNNIFLCGCGATGRLSLTIETLWRQVYAGNNLKDRVFSFMAGGDVALIRSIENFEDFPQYGARQLIEAGFSKGDLLIGTTEGGETPFVIGAVEKAAQTSFRKPFFLYCNPDDILSEAAERSRLVIENNDIEKINLTVGPMAVTGSTRMQASTILLAAAGISLLNFNDDDEIIGFAIDNFVNYWETLDLDFVEKFIIKESGYYENGEYLLYETDNRLGITVITDTTERSPTFSLIPFENDLETREDLSLCYLYLPDTKNSERAWENLLWRKPRTLEWPEIDGIASLKRLLGFDFSSNVISRREKRKKSIVHHCFKILSERSGINFSLGDKDYFLAIPFSDPLYIHLILKMILNSHSTLIMGRLGRYEGNVMTYVRASNNKLIDRAIRYIDMLLNYKGIRLSYTELCYALYRMIDKTPVNRSIVLETVAEIERQINRKKEGHTKV